MTDVQRAATLLTGAYHCACLGDLWSYDVSRLRWRCCACGAELVVPPADAPYGLRRDTALPMTAPQRLSV
jgi:hypothetical protein